MWITLLILPYFATTIRIGSQYCTICDLYLDLKRNETQHVFGMSPLPCDHWKLENIAFNSLCIMTREAQYAVGPQTGAQSI